MALTPRLRQGDRVDRFEIEEFLKQGGMGAVYVARDAATGARVALKVLAGGSAAEAARFEREGRLAARLEHPHVVAGLGHGRAEGVAWLAMELLRGRDLEAALDAGAPTPADVVAFLAQACDALAYAHARGVVHRDLKPSNLFLCDAPALHVKVLDFGIARMAGERQFTRSGAPLGTLAYMSPEQARGERDVDARTDLWSLGVVAYECLAGARPFVAESPLGVLYRIVEAPAPDLARERPDLPPALVDVVRRALSKRREGRPESAAAMRAMLDVAAAALEGPGAPAPRRPAAPAGMAATLRGEASATEPELRLVTAVVLRGARDPVFVQRVVDELGGREEVLAAGAQLCLFGVDRWSGDEPLRGVRLAAAVAPTVQGAGVVTGRALRSADCVAGAPVDAAALLARREGVHLDANTAPLVRGEFELAPAPDGTARLVSFGGDGARATAPPEPAAPLVGRQAELAVLVDAAAASAEEQRVRAVTVLGGAGLGKSRLRHEAAGRLATRVASAACLEARCDLHRAASPFAALRDALARAAGPSAAAVFEATAGGDPQAEVDRVRASLESLLAGLAERGPVVLSFDDAQWLDAASRAALRWLCDNAPYLPLTLWLFARPEARGALREVAPEGAVLELSPLARAEAEGLLRALTGAAPEALLERAGGHPLFLEELGRLYARRGAASLGDEALPVSVEGVHLAQLDGLDPADREFLKRAAVFGRHAWVEGVVALGGAPDAAPRLARAGLVVPRPRSRFEGAREVAFRAGTLRDVAYGLLPEPQQRRLHGLAARWLSGRPGVAADELARHWDLAGDAGRAAESYADAAERASAVADTATACAHAARALALTDDPALRWRALVARDAALQHDGDPGLAREGLAEMTALAGRLGPRHRVEACWRRCYFARTRSDREAALEAGRAALALARALGDPRWSAAVNIEMAMLSMSEGRADDARAHAGVAWESCAALDDAWLRARATATCAYVTGETGDLVEALELFEAAADGFERAGDRRREAIARANAGFAMIELGRVEEAERDVAASIEAAQRVGNVATVAMATHNLGVIRRAAGRFAEALALQERARALGARIGLLRVQSEAATELAYLGLAEGASFEECGRRAAEAAEAAARARAPALVAAALAVGLRAGARAGRVDEGAAVAARAQLGACQGRERAQLLVALYEACGRRPEDAAAARDAIEAHVARLDAPEDRAAARASFARRYLVPAELVGGG